MSDRKIRTTPRLEPGHAYHLPPFAVIESDHSGVEIVMSDTPGDHTAAELAELANRVRKQRALRRQAQKKG